MSTVKLSIITPEKVVYDGEASMVTVRTIDGDRGFLAEHQPLVTGLDIGQIKIKNNDQERILASSTGYIEVRPEEISILVDTAEYSDEIDVDRAKSAKERAEKRLSKDNSSINSKRAEIALKKAMNRLKVSKGKNFE
ncbi:ATP synthase F1 subcomplex epsilon subunit [Orenia metallireducens]|jgi:F-type H+-transporting ATPase subunit epsilon|uniref:ATP synthase epsilon chain n=1 Tax=Orenia metallireducens TaxID=1413210 RepID=A0A285GKN0_9FIRM|nr:F0F1 ATP synthase subunit epsilon [Orenia metallireducens]PRX35756.1 ATP synthase F1 subcomplex epsilon subunit [Orenia metallireducens]SNY24180.1 ATP synthase F1 subcomplex epsilon subunit [Orenia metallireducens]